jgi:hypothetical protein
MKRVLRSAHGNVQCLLAVFIASRRGLRRAQGRPRCHDEWDKKQGYSAAAEWFVVGTITKGGSKRG